VSNQLLRIPIPDTWMHSLKRGLAPHAYYDGDEEQLYEPVAGVYRSEHQRHVLVDD
jgi:hypothetical protein